MYTKATWMLVDTPDWHLIDDWHSIDTLIDTQNIVLTNASRFDRRLFRSKQKVSSIEDKSQFDRRVNDGKNYSFSSV